MEHDRHTLLGKKLAAHRWHFFQPPWSPPPSHKAIRALKRQAGELGYFWNSGTLQHARIIRHADGRIKALEDRLGRIIAFRGAVIIDVLR